jgi:hypothetical protein
MVEKMSDKYELYLFHLLLGIAYEEAFDLVKFGIPPTGVGHVTPFKKALQEKILSLFLETDGIVKGACIKMIEESVSEADDGSDAIPWMKTIVHALRMRSSLLMKTYRDEMGRVSRLLDEIDGILDEGGGE